MRLVSPDKRISELRKFGIPEKFLGSIGNIKQLEFSVEKPDSAYYYLPKVSHYRILKDLQIVPIYDCGHLFYVLAYDDNEGRIIKFELEQDQIYRDYRMNWNLLLLDIMINYFDIAIERSLTVDQFQDVGEQVGFSMSKQLYNLLNLPEDELVLKISDTEKWRMEIAVELKIL
jgi:hypothetical protein